MRRRRRARSLTWINNYICLLFSQLSRAHTQRDKLTNGLAGPSLYHLGQIEFLEPRSLDCTPFYFLCFGHAASGCSSGVAPTAHLIYLAMTMKKEVLFTKSPRSHANNIAAKCEFIFTAEKYIFHIKLQSPTTLSICQLPLRPPASLKDTVHKPNQNGPNSKENYHGNLIYYFFKKN